MFAQLLFDRSQIKHGSYLTATQLDARSTTWLNLEPAPSLLENTIKLMPTAILRKADNGHRKLYKHTAFAAYSYSPSRWALDALAQNIQLAITLHIQRAMIAAKSRLDAPLPGYLQTALPPPPRRARFPVYTPAFLTPASAMI